MAAWLRAARCAGACQRGESLIGLAHAVGADPFGPEEFRRNVARNLHEGAFRLIFAFHEITEDLKRAVEYLNARSVDGTEVLVLELRYSKLGDMRSAVVLAQIKDGYDPQRFLHFAQMIG